MSVQTVRIAPVEQWCEALLKSPDLTRNAAKMAGTLVQIDTATMRRPAITSGCDGREWLVVNPEPFRGKAEAIGCCETYWACEHILEMD